MRDSTACSSVKPPPADVGHALERHWQRRGLVGVALLPLAVAYCLIVRARRALYRLGILSRYHPGAPVIVVGNVTVGGTGKTPLVLWLVEAARRRGLRPGVVARGYGGRAPHYPMRVVATSDVRACGDEPLLVARATGCPVTVAPDRVAAARDVVAQGCNLVIADDGLQHYRLARDFEILVIDGARRFGNGWCLPAGPLREPAQRRADAVVVNGVPAAGEWGLRLVGARAARVDGAEGELPVQQLPQPVHAVAGIGNPARFFEHLRGLGLAVVEHAFPDHHAFVAADVDYPGAGAIVMTEKDAVKCQAFAGPRHWVLRVRAEPDAGLAARIDAFLDGVCDGQKTA